MNQKDLNSQSRNESTSPELQRNLADFDKQRVLNLESYKKNGDPVRTPVVFVEEDGRLYFQTARKAWKAKRIIRNPEVRVVPSTFRGEPKGDWIKAKAIQIEDEESKRIRRSYIQKLGLVSRMFFLIERLLWGEIAFFSITIDPSTAD